MSAIRNSYYLSTVFREVLTSDQTTLVIYGWGFGEQDLHILDQIKRSGIKHVAVSVYEKSQSACNHAAQVIAQKLGADVEVEFFDSALRDTENVPLVEDIGGYRQRKLKVAMVDVV